ncbi:MAG TPA: hypothetical protein VIW07_00810 [Candidatus Udaeobacter sp.]
MKWLLVLGLLATGIVFLPKGFGIQKRLGKEKASQKSQPAPTPPPLHFVAYGITPRVAQLQDTIYVVYEDDDKIKLVASGEGISWTSPQLISGGDTNVSAPAIVILDNGAKIITWKKGNDLRYLYQCMAQSTTVTLPFDASSIVNYDITKTGDQIHVVVESGIGISYCSFPGLQPPTTASQLNLETVVPTTLCVYNTDASHPAIAARTTSGAPEVVVAYYYYSNEPFWSSCQLPFEAGVVVKKRPSVPSSCCWDGVYGIVTPISDGSPKQPYSLSLTVNSTGVYFLAASDIVDSVSRVMLARGTVSSGWAKYTKTYAANQPRTISVSARRNQPNIFNLALTSLLLPHNYDETSKQVFGWPLASSAPFPGGLQFLDAQGKNARAADIRVCKGSNLCVMSTIFERSEGSGGTISSIVSDAVCAPSSSCPSPSLDQPPCL